MKHNYHIDDEVEFRMYGDDQIWRGIIRKISNRTASTATIESEKNIFNVINVNNIIKVLKPGTIVIPKPETLKLFTIVYLLHDDRLNSDHMITESIVASEYSEADKYAKAVNLKVVPDTTVLMYSIHETVNPRHIDNKRKFEVRLKESTQFRQSVNNIYEEVK